MKYLPINPQLFIDNRKEFGKHLTEGGMAVFNSNDIMPTNADGTLPFRQNNDIFWLSGVDQEETVLLLFPSHPNPNYREVLFVRETNEEIAIWEGEKLTKEKATEATGIKTVYWTHQFESTFRRLAADAKTFYVNTNEHTRANTEVETRDGRFIKWLKSEYPAHSLNRSAPILHELRAIKSETEVELMRTACKITEKAFRKVLEVTKPGIMEFEIEGEVTAEMLRNRSRGHAYQPIIASGFNACVLHYIENSNECKDGDVMLMDFGAEYANYASDMSRSIPISGRFTDRQKDVYNAVLRVMKEATNMLTVGTILDDYRTIPDPNKEQVLYHKEVGRLMENELIGLGLLDKTDVKNQNPNNPLYKKYFMHGTSHYIGLDVHDVGLWNTEMKAGMVFTCEPGIYIREESLGIRLENDILITENGNEDLMKNIPLEAEEIEDLMNS